MVIWRLEEKGKLRRLIDLCIFEASGFLNLVEFIGTLYFLCLRNCVNMLECKLREVDFMIKRGID